MLNKIKQKNMKLERKKLQKKNHLTKRVVEKNVNIPKRRVSTGFSHEKYERNHYSSRKTLPHKIMRLAMSLFSH